MSTEIENDYKNFSYGLLFITPSHKIGLFLKTANLKLD